MVDKILHKNLQVEFQAAQKWLPIMTYIHPPHPPEFVTRPNLLIWHKLTLE